MTDIKCKVAEAPKIEERLLLFTFLSYLTINYSNIFRIFQITFFYGLNNNATLLLKFLQNTLPKLHCPLVYTSFFIMHESQPLVRGEGLEPSRPHGQRIFLLLRVTTAALLRCSLDYTFTMRYTFRCAPSSLYTFIWYNSYHDMNQ